MLFRLDFTCCTLSAECSLAVSWYISTIVYLHLSLSLLLLLLLVLVLLYVVDV